MKWKNILEETFMCAPRFLACARLMTCVRAHSVEGTLVQVAALTKIKISDGTNKGKTEERRKVSPS